MTAQVYRKCAGFLRVKLFLHIVGFGTEREFVCEFYGVEQAHRHVVHIDKLTGSTRLEDGGFFNGFNLLCNQADPQDFTPRRVGVEDGCCRIQFCACQPFGVVGLIGKFFHVG